MTRAVFRAMPAVAGRRRLPVVVVGSVARLELGRVRQELGVGAGWGLPGLVGRAWERELER